MHEKHRNIRFFRHFCPVVVDRIFFLFNLLCVVFFVFGVLKQPTNLIYRTKVFAIGIDIEENA